MGIGPRYNDNQPRYLTIPTRLHLPGQAPSERTAENFDKTTVLLKLLADVKGDQKELLAELQFAFVSFLLGQTYAGFEQWKALLSVVCRSEAALRDPTYSTFAVEVIRVLRRQLKHVPADFFEDVLSGDNVVLSLLKDFFELLPTEPPELAETAGKFKAAVEKRFRVSFTVTDFDGEEGDEDAPMLVTLEDLHAQGMKEEDASRLFPS